MTAAVRPVSGDLGRRLASLEAAVARLSRIPTGKNGIGVTHVANPLVILPTLLTGWQVTASTAPTLVRDALGVVHLFGEAESTSTRSDGSVIFALPDSSWSPDADCTFVCWSDNGTTEAPGYVTVTSASDVRIKTAASRSYLPIIFSGCSWVPAAPLG